jgi:hypothetical protein
MEVYVEEKVDKIKLRLIWDGKKLKTEPFDPDQRMPKSYYLLWLDELDGRPKLDLVTESLTDD